MSWKRKHRCKTCGYEAEVYEGRGLFRQQITAVSCNHCHTIQNLVVGGIIADVAPSFRSEVGRLCLQCGSDDIRIWDMKTCPKCQGCLRRAKFSQQRRTKSVTHESAKLISRQS